MTDFEKMTNGAEHAAEIKQTRVGGLGGSDAALVLRIARNGIKNLNNTDLKRLAVMMGTIEPSGFGGNAYTRAGHAFEDVVSEGIEELAKQYGSDKHEREYVMDRPFATHFRCFAHADFAIGNFMCPTVIECKYVQNKTTEQVAAQYEAQLQWYYMLGASKVVLLHGVGSIDDEEAGTKFEVEDVERMDIERDNDLVNELMHGIKILDTAIGMGWTPEVRDKVSVDDVPEKVSQAMTDLRVSKEMIAQLKSTETESKKILLEYMDMMSYNGITSTFGNAILVAGKTTPRFNLKTFVKKITESAGESGVLLLDDVMKYIDESTTKTVGEASITFK